MNPDFKPMLACKDAECAAIPGLVSPKIDGVRAMVLDGKVYSRSLKLIPNVYVQQLFGRPEFEGLDGELVVGVPYDLPGDGVMQRTTSGAMRRDGEPDVTYHVFDSTLNPAAPFAQRFAAVERCVNGHPGRPVQVVPHTYISSVQALDVLEARYLSLGYEGVMVRDPDAFYKFGRSGKKDRGLVKIKRFEDDEATVIGVEQRYHNDNEATTDELGHTKRSSHKAGKRPAGDLGALICQTPEGVEFSIGSGFSAAQREKFWAMRDQLPGQLVTYRSFKAAGVLVAPRFPIFKAFRSALDL